MNEEKKKIKDNFIPTIENKNYIVQTLIENL